MVTQFRGILNFFNDIGIFDVVLPFLLVFTIVFALLERTKVFGVEEIEGKTYTKKNLNSVAAFVIAFLVVASSELVEVITLVSSNFVVLLFLVVLFLLLVGSFFMEKPHGVYLEGGWKTTFMVLVFVVLIFIFLDALGFADDTFGFLSGNNQGEFVGSVILIALIVLFIVYVTQERNPHTKKST
ncbi:MAG: hypothetical protein QF436_01090 [Candidatus Woesearchaeota archaeon]|jgi:hypothetical protein|nr:hypothetical protein [Candidatus Woesearchaeota archaeon]MDP7262999.1 hypothetical protein [Candidatus Woesearchaeota archaeon]MDP7622688.1 hypothetical protein [Candidatus Woesearchaeota archaeon]HJN57221.1 hypothetical protein [Candidatus Woesearchaeota archaeon]|tara:strand:+ start:10740 stop:11291 length:552 start_codon:yes stop_codon:yes gene_type:complete